MKIITIILSISVTIGCPTGWMQYREKCYFVSHMKATYPESVSYCVEMSAKLAEPRSPEENTFLEGYLRQLNESSDTHYYIGVIDYVMEHVYMYGSDLQEVAHPDWGPGEPGPISSSQDEDCIVISNYRSDHWADVPCSWKCKFVCERDLGLGSNPIVG